MWCGCFIVACDSGPEVVYVAHHENLRSKFSLSNKVVLWEWGPKHVLFMMCHFKLSSGRVVWVRMGPIFTLNYFSCRWVLYTIKCVVGGVGGTLIRVLGWVLMMKCGPNVALYWWWWGCCRCCYGSKSG